MVSDISGWCGKILKVNLGTGDVSDLDTLDYADQYLGGRGIATRIYWEEVDPRVSAFDPGNALIFMSGPLGATGTQGASRFVVLGKSPMLLPEGFCYGNMGGYFAPALKRAGYDGLVITGRADGPSYIWIHDRRATILDGGHLWGKGTREVRDLLRKTHGKDVHFLTTGPAGENRCRMATVITDHEGSATGGFGAVMGAKNLKAVAMVGTGRVPVARPDELKELNRETIRLSERGSLRMPLPKDQIRYVGKAPCYQCGLDCLRGLFRTASGREAVRKCQSMIFYMPLAGKRSREPMETALDATELCNDFSLCTMEMSNLIQWLGQCFRSGHLKEVDWGGDLPEMGTREFIEVLVTMVSRREGFGDLLAEGLLRTHRALGDRLPRPFRENMSGVGAEGVYSPREYVVNALLYALEPRQDMAMLHEVSYLIARWLLHRIRPELSPTTGKVFREAATRFWGHPEAWDMTTYAGKADATCRILDRTCVKDSLVLCDCAWPIMDSFNTPDHVGDPTLESRLFTAVTGMETDEARLRLYGERIFNLQRAILLREGRRPVIDDTPPEIDFTEPIEHDLLNPQLIVPGPGEDPVSMKGNILDRKKYEEMRREFYLLRGWDARTGLQKSETLERLGLGDVAQYLKKMGLVV